MRRAWLVLLLIALKPLPVAVIRREVERAGLTDRQ